MQINRPINIMGKKKKLVHSSFHVVRRKIVNVTEGPRTSVLFNMGVFSQPSQSSWIAWISDWALIVGTHLPCVLLVDWCDPVTLVSVMAVFMTVEERSQNPIRCFCTNSASWVHFYGWKLLKTERHQLAFFSLLLRVWLKLADNIQRAHGTHRVSGRWLC